MWTKVRELTKPRPKETTAPFGITAQVLNAHYAAISTDTNYQLSLPKLSCSANNQWIDERRVFHILDHIHPTATGLDQLPAWFLRLGAPVFASPIAQLFNRSLDTATVPQQWKKAIISPIPKILHPSMPAHYRPISITPVLSRVMERHVVSTFLYPALLRPPPGLHFHDQFAFRPTGSTCGALIAILHSICEMLTQNQYVRVFALDFSKAFDTVSHSALLNKLPRLDLPDEAYNWMKSFLDGHSHCTRFAGSVSILMSIFASVIQGSAIGPASYVVVASDIRPKTEGNQLFKFADDTYLLVPSLNADSCDDELAHVRDWACANNLALNQSKTLDLLVVAPGIRGAATRLKPPPLIPGIKRVESLSMLGVVVNDRLSADDHVTKTISGCSKSLYAVRVLRTHGMPEQALQGDRKSVV
jgi:hypothetical protein